MVRAGGVGRMIPLQHNYSHPQGWVRLAFHQWEHPNSTLLSLSLLNVKTSGFTPRTHTNSVQCAVSAFYTFAFVGSWTGNAGSQTTSSLQLHTETQTVWRLVWKAIQHHHLWKSPPSLYSQELARATSCLTLRASVSTLPVLTEPKLHWGLKGLFAQFASST